MILLNANFHIGDTFRNPAFVADDSSLQRFDYVLANPMWNQKEYDETFYANDSWGRFTYGVPPSSTADWAWVQHILASLKETGRAAIVLDTGAGILAALAASRPVENAISVKALWRTI